MTTKNAVGNSLTGSTGSGAFVGATSPTLVTPALGTPSSGALTNCTGFDYELISTASASNSSTIDFTGLTSTYTVYKIIFTQLVPQTDFTAGWIRLGTGGTPTYASGASDYKWCRKFVSTIGEGFAGDNADAQILFFGAGAGNNTGENLSGEITLYNPSNATVYKLIEQRTMAYDSAPDNSFQIGSGVYLSTTAVTAIRIMMSSGNITSGEFKLYGLRAS